MLRQALTPFCTLPGLRKAPHQAPIHRFVCAAARPCVVRSLSARFSAMAGSGTPRLLLAAALALVALPHMGGRALADERRFLRQPDKAFSINLPGISIHVGDDEGNSTTETDENTASPINYSDYVRKHGIDTKLGRGAEAVCLMQKDMDNDGTLCLAGASWLALTKIVPPQLGVGTVSKRPRDPSGNYSLPLPLTVFNPLPASINTSIVDEEKQTYYWYFRLVLNFYAELTSWKRHDDLDLHLPPNWEHLRLYNTTMEDGDGGMTAPLAASFFRDGHLVIVVRGTVYAEEWERDFNYAWTGEKNTTRHGFKGRVHAGFFDVFSLIVEDVQMEVSARNPSRITVVGHSLGGAVSAVLSYHLATNRGNRTTAIEAISFAGPMVGDEEFATDFNSKVNHRHVAFTGTGTRGGSYNIGDFISQIPCGTVSSCPLLDAFDSHDEKRSFTYAKLGGEVPFTYQDLKNSDTWQSKSDLTSFFYAPLANHLCAYSCFLAPSVGDREDHCFFPLDWEPDVAIRHRCNLFM